MKIALLGGSFNPPHMAHQMACLYLLQAEGFDRVWLLPCYRHAFAKTLAPFHHRVAMCALVARAFGGRVVVSEVEQHLARAEGNRTIDTVEHLKTHHRDEEFTLVMGSDIVDELDGWKDIQRLRQEVPFFVLRRAGFEDREPAASTWPRSAVTLPRVSASDIRDRLSRGQPVDGLVPAAVKDYIIEHDLYRQE